MFNSEERNRLRAAEAERNLVKHFLCFLRPAAKSFLFHGRRCRNFLHATLRCQEHPHELPFLLLSRLPPCQQSLGPPLSGSAFSPPLLLNHVLRLRLPAAR